MSYSNVNISWVNKASNKLWTCTDKSFQYHSNLWELYNVSYKRSKLSTWLVLLSSAEVNSTDSVEGWFPESLKGMEEA